MKSVTVRVAIIVCGCIGESRKLNLREAVRRVQNLEK